MHHQKWNNTEAKQDENHVHNTPSKSHGNTCHRYGMKGHWSRTCRTTKHLVDLYQASLKKIEMDDGDVCFSDYATTHTILQDKRYFLNLTLTSGNVSTISGTSNLIEGSRRANIMLPKGTRFHINDALYSRKSIRNLLRFKDIRRNGYHIETIIDGNK